MLITSLTVGAGETGAGASEQVMSALPVSVRASSRDGPFFEDPTFETGVNL